MEGLQRLATPCPPLVRWRWQVWYHALITTCSHVLKSAGDFQVTGESHQSLTAMLLKSIAMQLPLALRCFCKSMPFTGWNQWMKCISHVYHDAFAEVSGNVSGRWHTPKLSGPNSDRCNRYVRCNSICTPPNRQVAMRKSLSLLSNHRNQKEISGL